MVASDRYRALVRGLAASTQRPWQTAVSTCGKTKAELGHAHGRVFDYGPLNDPAKGFEVIYSSRQTNSAGDVKELYAGRTPAHWSLDKNVISGEGGLDEGAAKAMGMKNELACRHGT